MLLHRTPLRSWLSIGLLLAVVAVAAVVAPMRAAAEEVEQGAQNPRMATERLLVAFRTGDTSTALAVMASELRIDWDSKIDALLAALQIESFTLGELTEEGNEAWFTYQWRAEFDTSVYREGVKAQLRIEMERQGMDEAQVRRILDAMRDEIEAEAQSLRARFAQRELQVSLVREDDGRWYVSGFAEEPRTAGGGSTPEAAARRMLAAWADARSNPQVVLANFSELGREIFLDTDGPALLESLRVDEFELGAPRPVAGDENEREVTVQWKAQLDTERYVERMLAVFAEDLRADGLRGEQLAEELRYIREELDHEAQAVRSAFERREHTMRLTRVSGRWYVDQLIVDSTPDGTATAEEAALSLLDALAFDDPQMARFLIDPDVREEHLARDGLAWVRVLAVESSERVAFEEGEAQTATARIRWRASFDAERYERAARNAQIERLQQLGVDAEDIDERLRETRDDRESYAEHLKQLADADVVTLHLVKRGERWYVERIAAE